MRILVLYAHPVDTSFVSALHRCAIDSLRARGHDVDDCDLYAEGFDPVLKREERLSYHDVTENRASVEPYVGRLERAEGLVLIYPVWNFGFPAILKGFLDRVFLPGVSFDLDDGRFRPSLLYIKKLAAVCTYGGHRWHAIAVGDPPRRCVTRMLRELMDRRGSCAYLGHYNMNNTTPERRAAFLAQVTRVFRTW